MTILKRKDNIPTRYLRPGEYVASGISEESWIIYKCPRCGFLTSVGKKFHDVDYYGAVKPRVNCPHKTGSGNRCEFNDVVGLEDWVPKAKGSA